MFKAFVSCQMTTAFISFVASATIVIMVARSRSPSKSTPEQPVAQATTSSQRDTDDTRTSNAPRSILASSPYHRIIFGLSISDMILSLSFLTGPFAIDKSVPQARLAIGNRLTCKLNGLMFGIGSLNGPLYTLLLCYYCLSMIKNKEITNSSFGQKFEWKCHLAIIGLNVIPPIILAFTTEALNSGVDGTFCTISASPTGCRQNPEIYGDCDENIVSTKLLLNAHTFHSAVTIFVLLGIVACMGQICFHVMSTKTRIFRGANIETQSSAQTSQQDSSNPKNSETFDENITNIAAQSASGDCERYFRREIVIQALLYVLAFSVAHAAAWIVTILIITSSERITGGLGLFAACTYPLGGFFNILVYTRPKVVRMTSSQPLNWFQAFCSIVKNGVAIPIAVKDNISLAPRDSEMPSSVSQPDRESSCGVSSGMVSFSSIITPPGGCLSSGLSSGTESENSATPGTEVRRTYYPQAQSILSRRTDEECQVVNPSANMLIFHGINTIFEAEEDDEEVASGSS